MLLGVQLGGGHSELLVAVKPVVSQLMLDPSVSAQERAAVSDRHTDKQTHTYNVVPLFINFLHRLSYFNQPLTSFSFT